MYKLSFIIFILSIFSYQAYAQSTSRADQSLLIGRTGIAGSARIQAIGGGATALGGDISSAMLNPAGLGFYNRSSVAITPSFMYNSSDVSFLGNNASGFQNDFNIANFGIVFRSNTDNTIPRDWKGGAFAITFNRLNTYDANYSYSGINQSSIIDNFVGATNGINPSDLNADIADNFIDVPQAAFTNNLIFAGFGDNPNYFAAIPEGVTADQIGDIEERGQQTQWNIAYGGNFKDKLYIGASIGFRTLSYRKSRTHDEIYQGQTGEPFPPVSDDDALTVELVDYVYFEDNLEISGGGINANLGLIYRPIDQLTVGLSYQTPTLFSLDYRENFTLESAVLGIQIADSSFNREAITPSSLFEYSMGLRTPSRLSAGATYFFQKYGFLTANIDYLNYANSAFSSRDLPSNDINDDNIGIENDLTSAININVGGEARYDMFRFRLGYAYQSDPTNYGEGSIDRAIQTFSTGVGISSPKFFADLTVANSHYNADFVPYFGDPYVAREVSTVRGMLTLGFNF